MVRKDYPSLSYVRQCFEEKDGRLFWKHRPREHFGRDRIYRAFNTRFSAKESGSCRWNVNAFRVSVHVLGVHIYRSSVIWAFHNNRWPDGEIDHKDGNTLNDAIGNLRHATKSQNQGNRRLSRNSSTGHKGVYKAATPGKWIAKIGFHGKKRHLGTFDSRELACEAYMVAAKQLFGEFANAG